MKVSKRQLKRIIHEEKTKLLREQDAYDENAAHEFEEIMVQIGELLEHAF